MRLQAQSLPDPPAHAEDAERRRIRSFVLRQGRFTPAQQRAFAEHWSRYGLDPQAALQPRGKPLVLEIGFGNGEQLLFAAQNEPEKDLVGIEVHRPGVGRLMNALAAHNVENVRLYNHDAVEVIERCIALDSLAEVRIYFPDPWPKKRQQKRRLIQPAFIALLAARVARGGRLHLATDWADYAEQMAEVLDAEPLLEGGRTERWEERPLTRFERKGLAAGRTITDLAYRRTT
jgi:tRNA (guanine-N7-)-methyltransferase